MRAGAGIHVCGVLVALLLVSVVVSGSTAFAQDEEVDPVVFSPDSFPFGMSLGEWSGEWWKWFLSIPTDNNPINDPTGENCAAGQNGPVWMLVGAGGGKAERTCVVPAGKAILIPAITTECAFAEDASLKTVDDLIACAGDDQDLVQETRSSLNARDIPNYRVMSPLFSFTFPADNVFSAPEGPTQAISDGYWVMLTPLPPGEYELHTVGVLVDYTVTGPSTNVEDSTYHLTIEEPISNVFEEEVTLEDESIVVELNSSSTVTDFNFDEQARQVSFRVSGNGITEGVTTLPISRLLEGPYAVSVDGDLATSFATYRNQETGDTDIQLVYEPGTHDIAITGTKVVPEFPYSSIFLLLGVMSVIVILGKTKLVNNPIFHRVN